MAKYQGTPVEEIFATHREIFWYEERLKNAYLKFLKGWKVSVHDKDGVPIPLLIEGKIYSELPLDQAAPTRILYELFPNLLQPPCRVRVLAREIGRNEVDDGLSVLLSMIISEPGKKVNLGKSRQLVPACKNCDALLFSSYSVSSDKKYQEISDEHSRTSCPYCDHKLEKYWRTGLVHELEIDTDPRDWVHIDQGGLQFIMREPGGNACTATIKYLIPVIYRGKRRPMKMDKGDLVLFMQKLSDELPGKMFGPVSFGFTMISFSKGVAIDDIEFLKGDRVPLGDILLGAKELIAPRSLVYDDSIPVADRVARSSGQLAAAKEEVEKKAVRTYKQEQKMALIKDSEMHLDTLLASGQPHDARRWLSGVFLHVTSTKRNIEFAKFYAKPCNSEGSTVSIPVKLASKPQPIVLDEITMRQAGLRILINTIQHNQAKMFSEVKFFVLESMIQYASGPPHYYLEPVLNEPGKPTRIPKSTYTIKACKHCDVALLRFSFDWVVQRDDLAGSTCPYCNKPLEVVERERRVVPVTLDFESEYCKVTGTNNQIGALYHGQPVKLTVKVKSMLHFLQNYEAQFPNKAMGPFRIKMASQFSALTVTDIAFEPSATTLTWRPIVLYPEDLIAL